MTGEETETPKDKPKEVRPPSKIPEDLSVLQLLEKADKPKKPVRRE